MASTETPERPYPKRLSEADARLAGLVVAAQEGNQSARAAVLEWSVCLIPNIISKQRWSLVNVVSPEDMRQEGLIAADRAIRNYQVTEGAFGPYAHRVIERHLHAWLAPYFGAIEVKRGARRRLNREGVVDETTAAAARALQRPMFLSQSPTGDPEEDWSLEDEQAQDPLQAVLEQERMHWLLAALQQTEDSYRFIFTILYGDTQLLTRAERLFGTFAAVSNTFIRGHTARLRREVQSLLRERAPVDMKTDEVAMINCAHCHTPFLPGDLTYLPDMGENNQALMIPLCRACRDALRRAAAPAEVYPPRPPFEPLRK